MERVTRVVTLGRGFDAVAFEAAFHGFRQLFGVAPDAVRAAPDVVERYATLFGGAGDAHRRALRHDGVPLHAAILPPGTVVFEGEVDDVRMGDW